MSRKKKPVDVFISYTHDSDEHKEKVLALANTLRDQGINAVIDQHIENPPEGWDRWMINQITNSDFTLVVCTKTYRRRFMGSESAGQGQGSNLEGLIITKQICKNDCKNASFIPVIFDTNDKEYIPDIFGGAYYNPLTKDDYDKLYKRLTDQSPPIPNLGQEIKSSEPPQPKLKFDDNGVAKVVCEDNERVFELIVSPPTKLNDPNGNVTWQVSARIKENDRPLAEVLSVKYKIDPRGVDKFDGDKNCSFLANLYLDDPRGSSIIAYLTLEDGTDYPSLKANIPLPDKS